MTVPDAGNRRSRTSLRLLALAGFMGAGKTTVGRLLATQPGPGSPGWRFLDVDAEIESATGSTIAELFMRHGEPWFRDLEHRTIQRLIPAEPAAWAEHTQPRADSGEAPQSGIVLALGGGAIEDARNRELLLHSEGVKLVHLEVTLPEAIRRCTADAVNLRPVLADRERLTARYEQRLGLYRLAHLTIPVDGLAPEQVARQIEDWLRTNPS